MERADRGLVVVDLEQDDLVLVQRRLVDVVERERLLAGAADGQELLVGHAGVARALEDERLLGAVLVAADRYLAVHRRVVRPGRRRRFAGRGARRRRGRRLRAAADRARPGLAARAEHRPGGEEDGRARPVDDAATADERTPTLATHARTSRLGSGRAALRPHNSARPSRTAALWSRLRGLDGPQFATNA